MTETARLFERNAVRQIALEARHAAGRWEEPLDEPDWIQQILDAIGESDAEHCGQCASANVRWARDRSYWQPAYIPQLMNT